MHHLHQPCLHHFRTLAVLALFACCFSSCDPDPVIDFEVLVENQKLEPQDGVAAEGSAALPSYDMASNARFTLRDVSTGAGGALPAGSGWWTVSGKITTRR